MPRLSLYITYDESLGTPLYAAMKVAEAPPKLYPLYLKGTGESIYAIQQTEKLFKNLITQASSNGVDVVVSNFKRLLAWFRLEHYKSEYNVYDLSYPIVRMPPEAVIQHTLEGVEKLAAAPLMPWQKLLANASVVYQMFENRGILHGSLPCFPRWYTETYSGRSKVEGGLIHGFTDQDQVGDPEGSEMDYFLHFDWVSADLRVAALLSSDEELEQSFITGDPYSHLMSKFNSGDDQDLTRDEAKKALLSSINSFDTTSPIFTALYTQLGQWLESVEKKIAKGEAIPTLMGRLLEHNGNPRSMLNSSMQGSVAHALQYTIRKTWEKVGERLFAEIHDSIVCTVAPESEAIQEMCGIVSKVMCQPFKEIGIDAFFPIRVSIGKEWRKWVPYKAIRNEEAQTE